MTNQFLQGLQAATNVAHTKNGARTYQTTNSAVLDFFSQAGAMRRQDKNQKISTFTRAFAEDPLLALKALFYIRDVIGGQGERQTFRDILRYMANTHPEAIKKNLSLIPEFGRWDDLYELDGTRLEKEAYAMLRSQFVKDLSSEHPSLLGKWLKSENASAKKTRVLAKKTRKAFGLEPKEYRTALTELRRRISILETKMTEKKWDEIDYSTIPSVAGLKYRQAFYRNDEARYQAFLDSLKRGDKGVKVNTKALYPYDIVAKIPLSSMSYIGGRFYTSFGQADTDTLDVLWNNLPDYFDGKEENSICVVDTSGSMNGLPIQVAISLGIYAAERNKGTFKDHFITFSDHPSLQKIEGSNIVEKVQNLSRAHWDGNTNIEAVFNLILETAVKNRLSQDELPTRIFIISDMQFDMATGRYRNNTNYDAIDQMFVDAGYKRPALVFWNVNAQPNQAPATYNEVGVQLVSGCSPVIFKNLLQNVQTTAYDLMLDVLNNERYAAVSL